MNGELPEGWKWCSVNQIARYVTSGSRDWSRFYSKEGAAYFVRSAEINDYTFRLSEAIRVKLPTVIEGKRTLIEPGDILVTITGANVGKCAKVDGRIPEAYVSQSVALIKSVDSKLTPFVYFALRAPNVGSKQLIEMAYGVGRPVLSLPQIRSIEVPLPPLAEQGRIVAKLEQLLKKVDACQQRLVKIPLLLKRFRQSVLAAACSGRLTADWRDEMSAEAMLVSAPANPQAALDVERIVDVPETWQWFPVAALCDPSRAVCYGAIKLGPEWPAGVSCLRTSDVKPLRIETTDVKRIAPEISNEYPRTLLRGDEVLVNVRGTLGGVAVVPDELRGWNISREVALVPVEGVSSKFIALWIASLSCQNWLTGVAKGVAYTGINIEDLRLLPVAMPSLSEQWEIVRRVEGLLALADKIEARLTNVRSQVDKMRQVLLAKAFRGELVLTEAELARQEGRDYEPASVLLERVQQQRAGETSGESARATRSKASTATRGIKSAGRSRRRAVMSR